MRFPFGLLFFLITVAVINAQEFQSSRDCAECHVNIAQEWMTSRHAASTAAANPFYAAMLQWANKASDGQAEQKCGRCHAPVKYLDVTQETMTRLAGEGVTCDVCHATKASGGWLELGQENVKYGPYQDAISVVHKSEFSSFLVSNDQCLTCHSNLKSEHGFSFCSTEQEFRKSSFYKSGVTCQDCHMPSLKSKAAELGKMRKIHSHAFYGGYNSEILHNCALLSIDAKGDSALLTVKVAVQNKTVGHALPTGSPMRAVYLTLKALDADGNVVWQNFLNNPLKEDPQAVFMRLLQNKEGKAPAPPWDASAVKFDQRLDPNETRILEYRLSGVHAQRIVAELYYRLAPPALIKKLNIDNDIYAAPVLIASESIRID